MTVQVNDNIMLNGAARATNRGTNILLNISGQNQLCGNGLGCIHENILRTFTLIVEPLVKLTCGFNLYPTAGIGGVQGISFFCSRDSGDHGKDHETRQQHTQKLFGFCHKIFLLKNSTQKGSAPLYLQRLPCQFSL